MGSVPIKVHKNFDDLLTEISEKNNISKTAASFMIAANMKGITDFEVFGNGKRKKVRIKSFPKLF